MALEISAGEENGEIKDWWILASQQKRFLCSFQCLGFFLLTKQEFLDSALWGRAERPKPEGRINKSQEGRLFNTIRPKHKAENYYKAE